MSNKEENREWYYFLKEHHICVRCGKRDAFYNKTKCPECIEKAQKRDREHYAENREKILQRKKKYNNRLIPGEKQKGDVLGAAKKKRSKAFTV